MLYRIMVPDAIVVAYPPGQPFEDFDLANPIEFVVLYSRTKRILARLVCADYENLSGRLRGIPIYEVPTHIKYKRSLQE